MGEEEDLAVLIYKSSNTAKARAAAAAAAATEKEQMSLSEARQTTSTRKRSSANLNCDDGNRSAKAANRISTSKGERRPLVVEHEGGTHVPKKDAPTLLDREECALGMGQSTNDAAVKDAPIKQ
eukprot:scaffold27640_cov84-Skeletonema_dohrnii-CCMP3373.AAC.2